MKTCQSFFFVVVLLLTATGCTSTEAVKGPVFEWATRPELTADQQYYLHARTRVESLPPDSPDRQQLQAEAEVLAQKLEPQQMVRNARSGELVMSPLAGNRTVIRNPSQETLAFTVSVRGDEQWLGSRKASMGRLTCLPPQGTLIVPDLYWTTPRIAEAK